MKFFSFEDIKAQGSCMKFVQEVLGQKVVNGRCAAVWRGGKNPASVTVSEKEWYDHGSSKEGGGILELIRVAKFPGDGIAFTQSQEWAGEWIGLTPTRETKKWSETNAHFDSLIANGYKVAATYHYTDMLGQTIHSKLRMEHLTLKKEFLQRTPSRWGLGDVETILYRLPEVSAAHTVWVVEGEKDADTLATLGIVATTGTNGAGHWKASYTESLAGKHIIVCRDNDAAGMDHADTVLRAVIDVAASVKLICPSETDKGDVTDWLDFEDGSLDKLLAMADAAPLVTIDTLEIAIAPKVLRIAKAKSLNLRPLSNVRDEVIKGDNGKPKTIQVPCVPHDMVKEVFDRFLGFPKRIGDMTMFDIDKETDKVHQMQSAVSLFAWMSRKSGHSARWVLNVVGAMPKNEFFDVLLSESESYQEIAKAPYYPPRSDVFMHIKPLPLPSKDYSTFDTLINFFSLASEEFRPLLKALFAAPMFFDPGVQRPAWIIDSNAGQGTGKTTLVNLVGELYQDVPIEISEYDLTHNYSKLVGRLVSAEGRKSRIALLDNVTGEFSSNQLSALITAHNISGQAPYGRGEETRVNNLTYCITANSATVDRDLASRSMYIMLGKHSDDPTWERTVRAFIRENRLALYADILSLLRTPKNWSIEGMKIRTSGFAVYVLQPMCASVDVFHRAISASQTAQTASDVEDDSASSVEEIIVNRLKELGSAIQRLDRCNVFIRTDVLGVWLKDRFDNVRSPFKIISKVRNYSKSGMIKRLRSEVSRYPSTSTGRRGILWAGHENPSAEYYVVGMDDKLQPAVVVDPREQANIEEQDEVLKGVAF